MKRFLSILVLIFLAFSLVSCKNEKDGNNSQSQPETDYVAEAQKLLNDGKIKEAYQYLYTNRKNEKAAEMLEDFLVIHRHTDQKTYSRYNAKRVTIYNEHGDMIREDVTFPFQSYYSQDFVREYRIEYDSDGRMLKSTEIVNGTEETVEVYTYNEHGLVHTFQNGYKVDTYTYDADGNTILIFSDHIDSPYSETKEFTYDLEGNLLNEVFSYAGGGDEGDMSGIYYDERYTYDAAGNMIRKLYFSENNETIRDTAYTYNEHGDVLTQTVKTTHTYVYDGNEKTNEYVVETSYQYTYDDEGRVTKKITENPNITKTEEFVYNQQGDVVNETCTDSTGVIYIKEFEFVYSDSGEITQITEVQNSYTELTFDETFDDRGNITGQHSVTATDDRSNSTEYTYDEKGRVTKKVHTDPDGEINTFEYEYDDRNNVTKKTQRTELGNEFVYEYTYDDQNRVVKEVKNSYGSVTVTTNEYDEHGNLTKITENPSDGEKKVREHRYQYDERGNILKKEYINGGALVQTTEYEYDSADRVIKRTNYSAENKIIGTVTIEYDADGNTLREKCEAGEAGDSLTPYDSIYRYDEFGNMVYRYYAYQDSRYESWYSDFCYFYLPGRVEIK